MKVLVLNAGSSSIKYQLFAMPHTEPLCSGLVDRIGIEGGSIVHKVFSDGQVDEHQEHLHIDNHEVGLRKVVDLLTDTGRGVLGKVSEVQVVGHRVVHGGEAFAKTARITEAVKQKIKALFALAPLHNPPNYQGIEVAERLFSGAVQVAVFDTAFHQSMPEVAYRAALPKALYSELGLRNYGFHGTSHRYVARKVTEWLQKDDAKMISIHLGNGCSITALSGGKSVDTSMGLGPMGGLVMGTRAGDLDPSYIFHLIKAEGYSVDQVNELLNKKSGMLGLCGRSDMRDVKQAIAAGDTDAKLAYDIYAYRIRKYIGAYAAVLNGLDVIIFTAGVGENDAEMREAVCANMDFFGIEIDSALNAARSNTAREVQSQSSKVKIMVIPTNEELEIAQQSYALVVSASAK